MHAVHTHMHTHTHIQTHTHTQTHTNTHTHTYTHNCKYEDIKNKQANIQTEVQNSATEKASPVVGVSR